ncbi:MAG: acetyl-CoA carboxylase biotin carboxyl carrier protein subunit [Owenweeksia sp.]|nr:acetyl-CoA carboxylase biotin carboxyl carrier protein subunit [Owenweeksia sp.]
MYKIKIGESEYEVIPQSDDVKKGKVNGADYALDLLQEGQKFHLLKDNRSYNISLVNADYESGTYRIRVNANEYEVEAKDRFDLLLEELGMEDLAAGQVNDLKAPMPGLVLDVPLANGDEVKKGEAILVLEAMKMENVLKAEADAVIKSINVEKGQAVEKNQVLIEFDT